MVMSYSAIARTIMTAVIKNWKPLLAIALVGALWWKWTSMQTTIADLERDKAAAVERAEDLKQTNEQLGKLADTTQESIARIERLMETMAEDFGRLETSTEINKAKFEAALDAIRKGSAPRTNSESVDYLINTSDELRSRK